LSGYNVTLLNHQLLISHSGPLFSLITMATVYKELVFLLIAAIMIANYITMKCLLYKKNLLLEISPLYQYGFDDGMYPRAKEQGFQDSQNLFWKTIFTAWISPCIVWANCIFYKSRFLLATSTRSFVMHFLGLSSPFIWGNFEGHFSATSN